MASDAPHPAHDAAEPPERSEPSEPSAKAARHDPVYDALAANADFLELRRRYRSFVFPATIAFLAWFLLYVVMSNWAGDFMGTQLVGNINVALVFGLLQFLTTFGIAYLYSRYSATRLDPLAERLNAEYEASRGGAAGPAAGSTGGLR